MIWHDVFIPDKDGILNRIEIISKRVETDKFESEITETPEKESKATIIIHTDLELHQKIINEFQQLELSLAFSSNLKKIYWENPKIYNNMRK